MKRNGFSLIEVVVAVAVLAVCAGALVAAMNFIAQSQRKIHQREMISFIAENLKTRLIADSDFLKQTVSTNLFYDYDGREATSTNAYFRAELNFQSSTNYISPHLDSFVLKISPQNSLPSFFYLQRAQTLSRP